MSAGFLVILFVATLLVIAPTVLVLQVAWLRRGATRAVSVLITVVLVVLAVLFMVPSALPRSLEENAVLFLLAWSVLFAFLGTAAFGVIAVRNLLSRLRVAPQ